MYRLIVIDIMSTAFKRSNTSIREFNQEELDMVQDAIIIDIIRKKCCPYCGIYQGEETITVCEITLTTGKKCRMLADQMLPKGRINIKELSISTDLDTKQSTLIPNIKAETFKKKQELRQYLAALLTQH